LAALVDTWHDFVVAIAGRIGVGVAAAWVTLVLLLAVQSAHAAPGPEVTVIGDSIMTGVAWNPSAVAALGTGFDLRWRSASAAGSRA
jgi:hypothetical protein